MHFPTPYHIFYILCNFYSDSMSLSSLYPSSILFFVNIPCSISFYFMYVQEFKAFSLKIFRYDPTFTLSYEKNGCTYFLLLILILTASKLKKDSCYQTPPKIKTIFQFSLSVLIKEAVAIDLLQSSLSSFPNEFIL